MLTSGFIPPVDNRQVTGRAAESTARRGLLSRSDLKGVITHASQSLAEVSEFARHQLIGRPHNILRHPDVPDTLFHLMWNEIRHGREFFGVIKNRCRNGDHYWVKTRVAPVMLRGQIIGYTSARHLLSPDHVASWEQLFTEMRAAESGHAATDPDRFISAQNVLQHFLRRQGFDDLRSLALSFNP